MTPIHLYAVALTWPEGKESLYRVFETRTPAERYLAICQTTTAPEHWRLVEIDLPRNFLNDNRMIVR